MFAAVAVIGDVPLIWNSLLETIRGGQCLYNCITRHHWGGRFRAVRR
jgi:hypothetical protein